MPTFSRLPSVALLTALACAAAASAAAQPHEVTPFSLPPIGPATGRLPADAAPDPPALPDALAGPPLPGGGLDDADAAESGDDAVEEDPAAVTAAAASAEGEGALSAAAGAAEPARPAAPPRDIPVGSEPMLSLAQRAAQVLGVALGSGETVDPLVLAGAGPSIAQTLARALFAAPVAGSIPYMLHAEVYHDLTVVMPPEWDPVSVFVGDPARWALTRAQHLVILKPGEPGIRTNLTVVLANGDILQMDLQEVTGLNGVSRTGRVYVGPEPWLVDRIFGLLPVSVRHRVARSPATVAELLADPLTVIGLYGGTGAVPNPLAAEFGRSDAPLASVAPPPTLGVLDGLVPESEEPGPVVAPPPRQPAPSSSRGAPPAAPVPPGPDQLPRLISGDVVAGLEADLRAAVNRAESARVAAGDRIAAAQLNVEAEVELLREEYPLRTQFSYVLDPAVAPYTEPWWHFGVWHDGERTFARILGGGPQFTDEETGETLAVERLGSYLYRLDRLVDSGSVSVLHPDDADRERQVLYFRRRRELEGP